MIKRTFDVTVAFLALIPLAPLLLAVAVLIKIDSRGPVLFRQQRVGRGGKVFRIHKFRTMHNHAGKPSVSLAQGHRVTRLGHFLRKAKIDELPQLIDVLSGSMSLVGPRPELPEYVALWPEDRRAVILSVRPGITDAASIELRHESQLLQRQADPDHFYIDVLIPHKTTMYVKYVETRTFTGDLKIIARTARGVLRNS